MTKESSSGVFRWRVLSDQAVGRSQDDSFGIHAAFARLLHELAQSCATPFSVGLYSGWGTGKTSAVRMLEERIAADTPRSLGYVYLDVWKYVSDPLKRWILLETARQLQKQNLLLEDYTFDGRSLESHLEFEEEWVDKSEPTLGAILAPKFQFWFWIASLFGGSISAVLWVFADQIPRVLRLLVPLGSLIASAGILGLILRPMLELLLDYLKKIGFRRVTWNVRAKPAFSSEKFGAIFHDMVAMASEKATAHKIVFVACRNPTPLPTSAGHGCRMKPRLTSRMFWVSRHSESFRVFSRHQSLLLAPHGQPRSANLPLLRPLLFSCRPLCSGAQIQPTSTLLLPSMQSP